MSTLSNETICALSTPPGIGGLAVVRVSGPQAISIVDACFRGKRPLGEVASHTIHYGQFLRADGSVADYVTAAVFPRSTELYWRGRRRDHLSRRHCDVPAHP